MDSSLLDRQSFSISQENSDLLNPFSDCREPWSEPLSNSLPLTELPGFGDPTHFVLESFINTAANSITSEILEDFFPEPSEPAALPPESEESQEINPDPLTGMGPERTLSQFNAIPEFFLGNLAGFYSFSEFVGTPDPVDIYQFNVSQISDFSLAIDGLIADADVELYQDLNFNGFLEFEELIDSSAAANNLPESLNRSLQPGAYFIRVYQYSGDTPYNLHLASLPLPVEIDPIGNTLLQAFDLGVLSGPIAQEGFVSHIDTDDYYRFNLLQNSDPA